jgi:hypothetical protein
MEPRPSFFRQHRRPVLHRLVRKHLFNLKTGPWGISLIPKPQLGKSLSQEKGRDLIKQVRKQLLELARPMLESLVHEVTAEEVVVFSLAGAPRFQ